MSESVGTMAIAEENDDLGANKVQPAADTPSQEEVEINDDSLPFPTATIVRQMRKHITGKMISSKVKEQMNLFLGEIVEAVAKEMAKTRYSVVEMDDFFRATKPFTYAKELEKEKERVIQELERMKTDVESLIAEFNRKFAIMKADDFSILHK